MTHRDTISEPAIRIHRVSGRLRRDKGMKGINSPSEERANDAQQIIEERDSRVEDERRQPHAPTSGGEIGMGWRMTG